MSQFKLNIFLSIFLIVTSVFLHARAEVRVEEDEVVFILRVPRAKKVFLVGDFNNWNPTVEMMTREVDIFRTTLFLSPGNYHYKFVVDGKWISDPDNPAKDPLHGSELFLIERVGMLTLKSATESMIGENALRPSGRVRGDFSIVNGEMDAGHQIDLFFDVDEKFARAKVNLITRDDSWSRSPFEKDIAFDRGKVELKVAGGKIVGFENDSIWASHDPLNLFGNVGIYGYNTGLERRGITLEEKILKLRIRALYSDRLDPLVSKPMMIDSGTVASFLDSLSGKEILYSYDPGYYDEDSFGGEIFLDVKEFKIGYVKRGNRGMHRGLMVEAEKIDSTFTSDVSSSRENWEASAFWSKAELFDGLSVGLAFGKGRANVEKLNVSHLTLNGPTSITSSKEAEESRSKLQLQESKIFQGSIEYKRGTLFLTLDYRHFDFDFLEPVFRSSNAIVDIGTLSLSYKGSNWNLDGSIVHTQQDYRDTPNSFSYFSPLANYWLDYADRLTVENMLGFAMHAFTIFQAAFSKGHRDRGRLKANIHNPFMCFSAGAMMGSIDERVKYAYAMGKYERYIKRNLYIQMDARVPYYSDSPSTKGGFYADPYVEVGYRSGKMELSMGLGLDPVAFDPARNDYFNIGRLEYLRRGSWEIASKYIPNVSGQRGRSSRALELRKNLIQNEESLQKRTRLKIELIVVF